jgi:2-oxo-4-hydroxy-4-carboxy-5-ureidoimidazoline decarboxylase
MSFIETWNAMSEADAAAAVLPCCGSHAWAHGLAARRPLSTLPELLAASDAAWWSLPEADWKQAFDSHPRIGEQHAQGEVTPESINWSIGEQGLAVQCDEEAKKLLALGNRAYEQKFGRIFIVCATGKSTQEMLGILERRMHHTAEEEMQEAAEQQRQITHIRLQKWLAQHEAEVTA